MIRLFSSDLATAIANLVVFLGLCWGAIRLIRPPLARMVQRLSSRSRKARQRQIMEELSRLRRMRNNTHILIYEVVDEIVVNMTIWMIGLGGGLFTVFMILRSGSFMEPYLPRESTIDNDSMKAAMAGIFLIFAIAFYEIRGKLRIIKRVGYFENSRERLLREYIRLRGLR